MSKSFAVYAASAASAFLLAACAAPRLGRLDTPAKTAAKPSQGMPAAVLATAMTYPQNKPLDEKRPVKIKSDRLRYDDARKETEFIGHVVATQDSSTLYADRMRSATQGESASASGNLRLVDPVRKIEILAQEGDYLGALSEANLKGGVTVISVDPYAVPVTLTGQSVWYQSQSRAAKIEGGVWMERGDLTATAERAQMLEGGESVELSGGVKAELGANRVEAESALMDGKKKSVAFVGGVKASLIPAQLRERAGHPERP